MPILWILVPLIVLALGVYYIGRQLVVPFNLPARKRRLAWILIAVWGILMYSSLMLMRIGGVWSTTVSWIGYLSMGLLSFLFWLVVARDVIRLVVWCVGKVKGLFTRHSYTGAPQAVDTSRRQHLLQMSNIGLLGVAGIVTSYGVYEARKRPGIVEITVPIPRLPTAFEGVRIVQISDVHAGLTVGRDWVEMVAEETASLNPDLLVFTGDMVDGSVYQLRNTVAPFADLQAPLGKYFITGNHEYYSGAEEWVKHIQKLGYDVLMNEHRIVQRGSDSIVIAGVTDYTAGNYVPSHASDPNKALRDAPTDKVRIFLAHQPKTLRKTAEIPFDLMLSGHTHGGQFFPWNLLATVDQPYIRGLHRTDNKWVYVNKGTGYWGPPVRVGARSEITVVRLTREA